MKIGNLHMTWLTSQAARNQEDVVIRFLRDHPAGHAVIARMARSEVKNYLAELAEAAEVPFGDPVQFIRGCHPEAPVNVYLPDAAGCPSAETVREHEEHAK
jgi:hypothetical protein